MAVYQNIIEGIFLDRPNRFIARVCINGREEICHVKNTGRCREILVPGCKVYLEKSANPMRKTAYDLIAAEKVCGNEKKLINMDSQVVNQVAFEWIEQGGLGNIPLFLKREVTHGESRFDIYGEFPEENNSSARKTFIEVKGVTLEKDGVVRFPDAPTERGIKHVRGLAECVRQGFDAYIIFIVQMAGVRYFEPNYDTHPEFGEALLEAEKAGVKILALECRVEKDLIVAGKKVEVHLLSFY